MIMGAGQGKRDTAAEVRRAAHDDQRQRRRVQRTDAQRHDEAMRAAALQAAVTALAPYWGAPSSVQIGGPDVPDEDELRPLLALAERFERFIGEAGPPDHPGLADDPAADVGGWPPHPGLG